MTDPTAPRVPPLDVGNPFLDLAAAARLEWWQSPQWPDKAGLTIRSGGGTLTIGLSVEDLDNLVAGAVATRDRLTAASQGIIVPNGNLDALRKVIPPPPGAERGGA